MIDRWRCTRNAFFFFYWLSVVVVVSAGNWIQAVRGRAIRPWRDALGQTAEGVSHHGWVRNGTSWKRREEWRRPEGPLVPQPEFRPLPSPWLWPAAARPTADWGDWASSPLPEEAELSSCQRRAEKRARPSVSPACLPIFISISFFCVVLMISCC